MVTRKRLRTILTALGLYALAAAADRLFRRQRIQRQSRAQGAAGYRPANDGALRRPSTASSSSAGQWQRRIALLKSTDLDPDMLDERARALLDYAEPNDLTLMLERHPSPPLRQALEAKP